MGICLGINPEIQNKPADPYDNRKCSGMRIFQDLKLFFFCFIRTECICCIQKTIQMDPSGDQNRDQDQNCCKKQTSRELRSDKHIPQKRCRSDHSPDCRKKADTVLHTFFCPFHLRHWDLRIHRKSNAQTSSYIFHAILFFPAARNSSCDIKIFLLYPKRDTVDYFIADIGNFRQICIDPSEQPLIIFRLFIIDHTI